MNEMMRTPTFGYLEVNTVLFAEKVCSALADMGGAEYSVIRESFGEGTLNTLNPVILFIEFSGKIIGNYVLSLDASTAAALVGADATRLSGAADRDVREEFSGYLKEVLNVAVGRAIGGLEKKFGDLTFLPATIVYGEIEFPRFMGASIEIEGREGKLLCGILLNMGSFENREETRKNV